MIIKFSRFFYSKQSILCNVITKRIRRCNLGTAPSEENLNKKLEYLLILDFEATCDRKKMVQEIIEFPCLKINLANFKEEGRFHHYVRPVLNPVLTDFCVELTGILQEMVDDEKMFPEVYELFKDWRESEGLTDENSIYITSGDWDLGHMMPRQCEISGIEVPSHMMQWIDIKKLHGNISGNYFDSFIQIIKYFGLTFEGRQHSGICDCLNILNVVKKMAALGIEFKPTSRLKFIKNNRKVEIIHPSRTMSCSNYAMLLHLRGRSFVCRPPILGLVKYLNKRIAALETMKTSGSRKQTPRQQLNRNVPLGLETNSVESLSPWD